MRLYSAEEIERLRFIKRLVEEEGVNLAGVQRLLALAEAVQRIRPLLDEGLIARDAACRRRLLREMAALDDLLRAWVRGSVDFKDYYSTLGVAKTATEKEIKQAFRKLARKFHPDVNPGDKAAEARFKEINEANEVLSDPAKRKKYDELGANWRQYQNARPAGAARSRQPGGQWNWNSGGGGFRTMTEEEVSEMFGGRRQPLLRLLPDLLRRRRRARRGAARADARADAAADGPRRRARVRAGPRRPRAAACIGCSCGTTARPRSVEVRIPAGCRRRVAGPRGGRRRTRHRRRGQRRLVPAHPAEAASGLPGERP